MRRAAVALNGLIGTINRVAQTQNRDLQSTMVALRKKLLTENERKRESRKAADG